MATEYTAGNKMNLQGMAPLLQVFDMSASLRFYCGILGFEMVASSGGSDPDWVLLRHNGVDLMLNTLYERDARPEARDLSRQAVHQDITLYFGCNNIDMAYQQLAGSGVVLNAPAITGYGWKAINFLDPDGYAVCFHWPVEENAKTAD